MYSDVCEKLMEQNANNFIAHFNEIDKYLDKLLQTEKFLPYNEKLKHVIEWTYNITPFVKKHLAKLKYFGELRNHITHGQQIEGQYYSVPTYHAVEQIRKCKDEVLKPMTCFDLFTKEIYTCKTTDLLQNVIIEMRNHSETHIPVYDATWHFVWMLTETTLSNRLADEGTKWAVSMNTIRVWDLDLTLTNDTYVFVAKEKSIYEVEALFEQQLLGKKKLGAVFISEKWSEKETIEGVITPLDLPKIAQYDFIA